MLQSLLLCISVLSNVVVAFTLVWARATCIDGARLLYLPAVAVAASLFTFAWAYLHKKVEAVTIDCD